MNKIEQKITGYKVVTTENTVQESKPVTAMSEHVVRPNILKGYTAKFKEPASDTAYYLTLNVMELDGMIYPYEVFINSKHMENYQWVAALTRLVSAVFRKGGDYTFLLNEMQQIFNPAGGFYEKGKYHNSLVARIGYCIENLLIESGCMEQKKLPKEMQEYVDSKKQPTESSEYPANATLCGKCNTKAVILMDGCSTCLNCCDSKCG